MLNNFAFVTVFMVHWKKLPKMLAGEYSRWILCSITHTVGIFILLWRFCLDHIVTCNFSSVICCTSRSSFYFWIIFNDVIFLLSEMTILMKLSFTLDGCHCLQFLDRLFWVDLIKWVSNDRPYVRPSVRPQKVFWFQWNLACR